MLSKLLVVHPNQATRRRLVGLLSSGGSWLVMQAASFRQGLHLALQYQPLVIIVGDGRPGASAALRFCWRIRTVRPRSRIALIVLSIRVDEEAEIRATRTGVDRVLGLSDFETDPTRIFLWAQAYADHSQLADVGRHGFELNPLRRSVRFAGKTIRLRSWSQMHLLSLLAEAHPKPVSVRRLLRALSGANPRRDHNIATIVSRVNKRFGRLSVRPIENAYGQGYRLSLPSRIVLDASK